jgi:hypothetical protein
MARETEIPRSHRMLWAARLAVGIVFLLNITCATAFLLEPERYRLGFEVSGVAGSVLVRGMGILFLMWNATYPLVLVHPDRHRVLFTVLLAQQAIGLAGESWLWLTLPPNHAALRTTGLRFIVFDGIGLVAMALAYALLRKRRAPRVV